MDIPEDLLRAYELVRPSSALDESARRRIEADLFHASVAFVRSYPPRPRQHGPHPAAGSDHRRPRPRRGREYVHDAVRPHRAAGAAAVLRRRGLARGGRLLPQPDGAGAGHPGPPAERLDRSRQTTSPRRAETASSISISIRGCPSWPGRGRCRAGCATPTAASSPSTTPGRGRPARRCPPRSRCCCRPSATRAWGEEPRRPGAGAPALLLRLRPPARRRAGHDPLLPRPRAASATSATPTPATAAGRPTTLSHNTVTVDGRDQHMGSESPAERRRPAALRAGRRRRAGGGRRPPGSAPIRGSSTSTGACCC